MRIAMLAPIWERVPPPAYGGIELVVGLLADGLVARGHEVTLFATGDSLTQATLCSVVAQPLRHSGVAWQEGLPYELVHLRQCFDRADEFDVIHNHMGCQGLALAAYVGTPVVTTLHGPIDGHMSRLFATLGDLPFVSISHAQRSGAPEGMHFVATVYNGIETRLYQPSAKEGYLLNLGRISPEKGTHLAVEAALRTGRTLVIAGKVDSFDQAYYEDRIRPHLDGERVRYIGEVGGADKVALLAGADALVHPVQWPEPFGLVMAEALAAGTPVIAYPFGSIPEVVEDGLTGFVVNSPEAMVEAIAQVDRLDPADCRQRAVERFDVERMILGYEAVFEQVLASQARTMRF